MLELNGVKRQAWNESHWGVAVKCSDYDSLTSISRIAGSPDLEYMLRLNQIMINFVKDKQRDEYVYIFCTLFYKLYLQFVCEGIHM